MPFLLKVLNAVNFICIVPAVTTSVSNAFMVAAIMGFIITAAFTVAHFSGFTLKVEWPWPFMEIIYTEIWMLYYFIVTGILISMAITQYIPAGVGTR